MILYSRPISGIPASHRGATSVRDYVGRRPVMPECGSTPPTQLLRGHVVGWGFSTMYAERPYSRTRTNNPIKGWHSHLNRTIGCSHPNTYQLLTVLTEKLLLVTHNVKLPDFRTSPTQPGKPDDIAVKVLSMLSPSMLNDHIPRSVLGDGNCMYRALSCGLFGTENYHLHVRLHTALDIIQNRKLYDVSGVSWPCV